MHERFINKDGSVIITSVWQEIYYGVNQTWGQLRLEITIMITMPENQRLRLRLQCQKIRDYDYNCLNCQYKIKLYQFLMIANKINVEILNNLVYQIAL